ncbi:alpha/beta fold hydrolase [Microbacterium sp. CJ88]|uniref:alpha/beta fold hydrolase n=1 Tax=Microbacterium sp. CJ88 TaxID=3445672 RepID=UPI003F65C507
MHTPPTARRSPALLTRERDLGLRRVVVPTALGRIVVRTGRRAGGPATILLHGAAGSWTTWTPVIAASDRSAAPLTDVVAVDLPGWGESGDLAATADASDLAAAVIEVARALGYDRWRLVGHSLGGFVALELAAQEPGSTLSVTLVSPSGAGVLDAVRRPLRGGMRTPGFAGMLLTMRLLAAFGAGGRGLVRLLARAGWMRALSAPLFARPRIVHASVIDALPEEIRPRAFARAARRAAAYDTDRWRRVTCPVHAVRGVRDVFAGPDDRAVFASLLPGFVETRLPDAGHFAHIERPDAVLTVLREAVQGSPAHGRTDVALRVVA